MGQIGQIQFDRLQLKLDGTEACQAVKPVRPFPLTAPDTCVFLMDTEGQEIGMIENTRDLDDHSRSALNDELSVEYFMTQIVSIRDVKSRHGVTTWQLETERGSRTIHVKDRTDIRKFARRRLVFTDIDGMKYEIADAEKLDERSQACLEAEA